MYAVKVEFGKERIRVRHYRDGFLPYYISCAESDVGKRKLVVPGYVFTMTKVNGAEKVPDPDWAVIEAISDKQPSYGQCRKSPLALCSSSSESSLGLRWLLNRRQYNHRTAKSNLLNFSKSSRNRSICHTVCY